MKKICVSAAFGTGNSMLKLLTMDDKKIDAFGTCHTAWGRHTTINGDRIDVTHLHHLPTLKNKFSPDITAMIWVNQKNLIKICQRIVALEFLYAQNSYDYVFYWTKLKHNSIAGPSWPEFSTKITDYPTFCLDELCKVAHNRVTLWENNDADFDFQIDSNELFGDAEPVTITKWLTAVDCKLDWEFLDQWKTEQTQLFLKYQSLFTWKPGDIDYITELPVDLEKGVW